MNKYAGKPNRWSFLRQHKFEKDGKLYHRKDLAITVDLENLRILYWFASGDHVATEFCMHALHLMMRSNVRELRDWLLKQNMDVQPVVSYNPEAKRHKCLLRLYYHDKVSTVGHSRDHADLIDRTKKFLFGNDKYMNRFQLLKHFGFQRRTSSLYVNEGQGISINLSIATIFVELLNSTANMQESDQVLPFRVDILKALMHPLAVDARAWFNKHKLYMNIGICGTEEGEEKWHELLSASERTELLGLVDHPDKNCYVTALKKSAYTNSLLEGFAALTNAYEPHTWESTGNVLEEHTVNVDHTFTCDTLPAFDVRKWCNKTTRPTETITLFVLTGKPLWELEE